MSADNVRCDRHVGEPYPPRCFDCDKEAETDASQE